MLSFFSYYGGKFRDALINYPAPAYDTIIEPFAGAAGYSTRYFDRRIHLYDIDPIIVGVWRYLIRVSPVEIMHLPDIKPGESIDDWKGVCEEARWLAGFWLNTATTYPCKTMSKWRASGPERGTWGVEVKRRIARQVDLIRHWKIFERSYGHAEGPATGATWFVDPPYQIAGNRYRFGCDRIDYHALGAWCRSRVGQVIACEGGGASWLPFTSLGAIRTARARNAEELVWLGGVAP